MNRVVPFWVYALGISICLAAVSTVAYQLGIESAAQQPVTAPLAPCMTIETGDFAAGMEQVGTAIFVLLAFLWLATVDYWSLYAYARSHVRRRRIRRIRLSKEPAVVGVIPDTEEGRP